MQKINLVVGTKNPIPLRQHFIRNATRMGILRSGIETSITLRSDVIVSRMGVIEIKMDRPVSEAMKKIYARKYYTSLLAEKLPITLVGMRCSSKERAVVDLTVEVLSK